MPQLPSAVDIARATALIDAEHHAGRITKAQHDLLDASIEHMVGHLPKKERNRLGDHVSEIRP